MKLTISMMLLISLSVVSCSVSAALIHSAEFSRDKFGIRINLGNIGGLQPTAETFEFGPNATLAAFRNPFWKGQIRHFVGSQGDTISMTGIHLVPPGAEEWGDWFFLSEARGDFIEEHGGPNLWDPRPRWSAVGHGSVLHPPKYEDLYAWHYSETLRISFLGGIVSTDKHLRLTGIHIPEPPSVSLFGLGFIFLLFQARRSGLIVWPRSTMNYRSNF